MLTAIEAEKTILIASPGQVCCTANCVVECLEPIFFLILFQTRDLDKYFKSKGQRRDLVMSPWSSEELKQAYRVCNMTVLDPVAPVASASAPAPAPAPLELINISMETSAAAHVRTTRTATAGRRVLDFLSPRRRGNPRRPIRPLASDAVLSLPEPADSVDMKIKKRYLLFGGIPRQIFNSNLSQSPVIMPNGEILMKLLEYMSGELTFEMITMEIEHFHNIVLITKAKSGSFDLNSAVFVYPSTIRESEVVSAAMKYEQKRHSSSLSAAIRFGALEAHKPFELAAHHILQRGGTFKVTIIGETIIGENREFELQLPGRSVNFFSESAFSDVPEASEHSKFYCRPSAQNFAAVDAMYNDMPVVFQMTIGQDHPINYKGLGLAADFYRQRNILSNVGEMLAAVRKLIFSLYFFLLLLLFS